MEWFSLQVLMQLLLLFIGLLSVLDLRLLLVGTSCANLIFLAKGC